MAREVKALLQFEAYLQAVEHDGINDDSDPRRNEPIDELAGTYADLVDPLRLGRILYSLLDRGALERLSRYQRVMQRDLISPLKLYRETQKARSESSLWRHRVDVPRTNEWAETSAGKVIEKSGPP